VVAEEGSDLLPRGLPSGALDRSGVEGADNAGIEQGLKYGCASLQAETSERAFTQADAGGAGGGAFGGADTEEMADELGDVGVMADDEDVLKGRAFAQQALELRERGRGGERVGDEDFLLVAGLGGNELSGL
jgi:hypothetical protein